MNKNDFDNFDPLIYRFRSFVASLDNEDRYDWIRAAGKAFSLWNGSDNGLVVFDDWSSSASNYKGIFDCAYHYFSFEKEFGKSNKYKSRFRNNQINVRNGESKGIASIDELLEITSIASECHPYLKSHKVRPHGIRQYGQNLMVPMYDLNGKIVSFQHIDSSGRKRFRRGEKVKNLYYLIGEIGRKVIFTEGFATGASIHEASNHPVVVTFNANNLKSLPKLFRKRLPRAEFYIAADDDYRSGGSSNTGMNAAVIAARRSHARVIIPLSKDGVRRKQDFCDVLIRDGILYLSKILEDQINE